MTKETVPNRALKRQRISLRASERQEQLIRRAADATDRTITDFVLESASVEAERILADRRWFVATDEQWQMFNELLDAPLQSSSKLRELAERPSPFEA